MAELSLFNEEKVVSVKELANELKVSDQTIRNTAKRLFSDPSKVLLRVVNGGTSMFFTYEQATAIKLKLRERNNLKDNSVVTQIGNDLEFFALVKKRDEEQKLLDAYRDRRIAELTAENTELKTTNNLLMHTQKTYTASEIAKELGLSSAQKLNEQLKKLGVQYKRNGTWLPTAKYAESDFYEIKQEVLESGIVVYNSRITQKGREFILKLHTDKKLIA